MNNDIKNFDRAIEQLLNDSAVQPPYGMWNRISTELDTEQVPAAPQSAVTPPQPSGLNWSHIASASIAGISILAAFLFTTKSDMNNKEVAQPVTVEVTEPALPLQRENENQVEATIEQPDRKVANHIASKTKGKSTPSAVVQPIMQKAIVIPGEISGAKLQSLTSPANNTQEEKATEDTYYFPPIDIDVTHLKTDNDLSDNDEASQKDDDKKLRIANLGSEKRIKFKKRRKGGFSYGRLNRLKSPR